MHSYFFLQERTNMEKIKLMDFQKRKIKNFYIALYIMSMGCSFLTTLFEKIGQLIKEMIENKPKI